MEAGYRETTLRPRGARLLAAAVLVICAVALVGFATQGDPLLALRAAPALGLAGVLAWAAFWRPSVRVGPSEVELVNVLRTVQVTWPAVEDVETRWGLVLVTARGRFTAWAAPRPGAAANARAVRDDRRRFAAGADRAAELGPTPVAPLLVLRRWAAYRDAGLLGAVEGPGVVVRWHGGTVVAVGLLVLACVVAALAP